MASNEGNVNDFCRLCASETMTGVVIYSSEGLHLCLEEKIIRCLRIEVSKDDMLPKKVCCPCQSRLEETHRFAEQAKKVQHTLQLLVQMSHEIQPSCNEEGNNMCMKKEGIKDEMEDFPLDVTIEIESERRNESVTQHEKYNISGVKTAQSTKNRTRKRIARKITAHSGKFSNRRKNQQPQKSDSSLQKKMQEKSQNSIPSTSSPHSVPYLNISEGTEKVEEEEQEQLTENEDDVKGIGNRESDEDAQENDYESEENKRCEEVKKRTNISKTHSECEKLKLEDTRKANFHESDPTWNVAEEEEEDDDDDDYDDNDVNEGEEKESNKSNKEEWKTRWGIKCNECNKIFPYRSQFDTHYKNSYDRIPIYTCSYCNKTMEKYSTFRSHCYRHVTEGRYRCEYCQKGFSLRSMLHVHILAKHTSVKPFTCEECDKGFVTRASLNIHLKKHKTDEKQEYPCSECGKMCVSLRFKGLENCFIPLHIFSSLL